MFYLVQKNLKKSKLALISTIILGLALTPKLFSSNYKKKIDYSLIANESKSFITKAIEKSGPSVVTIDTQRLVNSRNPKILIDPYFEKFFGLKLPYEEKQRKEQGQGSGDN